MKLVYEGYRGMYPNQKRGRGKWYPLYHRELFGSVVEVDRDYLVSLAKGYRFTRWRVENLPFTDGGIDVQIIGHTPGIAVKS